MSPYLSEGSHYLNLYPTSRSSASESSSEMKQLRHDRVILIVRSRNLETETLRCQSTIRPLEAPDAQVLRLTRMLDVKRQKSNTPQADVLLVRAEIHRSLKVWLSLRVRLRVYEIAASNFGITLSPHSTRGMKDLSQELEWMQLEEHQLGSAATEWNNREPSSFFAAGDRLLVHLSSSQITACPEDTRTS